MFSALQVRTGTKTYRETYRETVPRTTPVGPQGSFLRERERKTQRELGAKL